MLKQLFQNRGLFIIITVCVVTLWLYFSNKLVLFVHPRYFLFTALAAGIGLILSLAALFFNKTNSTENDEKDNSSRFKIFSYMSLTGLIIAVLALFTPTSLSTENVNLARVNNFTFGTNEIIDVDAGNLTVKNWSTILSSNLTFDETQEIALTGFLIPIDKDNFFLARYVLSCCAIDAQPVAIPVYSQNWGNETAEGDWISIKGKFSSSTVNSYSHSLVPNELQIIEEPKEPYDY